jgi:NTE family protein
VVVVNPVVPYVNDFATQVRTLRGRRPRRVSDMGFPQIGYQTFKLIGHQRLHEATAYWGERYPGVDIVLVEPEPRDELMFTTSIMNYAARIAIARHGFQSVAAHLAAEYERYREVSERHGLEISGERLRTVVEHFEAAEPEQDVSAWRRILGERTGGLLRQSESSAG